MRRAGLTLSAFLAAAPAAFAQAPLPPAQPVSGGERVPVPGSGVPAVQPGGVPAAGLPVANPSAQAPAPVDPKLNAHLDQWEKTFGQAQNFYAEFTSVRKHLVLNKTTEYTGSVICLKPNLARMRIQRKDKADEYKAFICNGRAVFEYDGGQKTVTEFKLKNGGVGDNLLLSFMSGTMKAADVLGRFDIKLVKEDANYVYLEMLPRFADDRREFESLTLVLFQPTVPGVGYLPRAVVMRLGNGQEEERWDFPHPRMNVQGVKVEHFEPEPTNKLPKDWKVQQAPTQPTPSAPPAQPRVARPAAPGQ